MILTVLTYIACGLTLLLIGTMAWLFWTDPERGLRETTHRRDLLPRVMADRYTAFAFLTLAFTIYGDFNVLAILFVSCAIIGFCDGWIYARAGQPHFKHTFSGVLAIVALAVTLAAQIFEKGS